MEGYGFEAYAQANTTFVIGDAIEQALSLLNSQLPTAKDLKDINSIKQAIKDVADIGNQAVDLVKWDDRDANRAAQQLYSGSDARLRPTRVSGWFPIRL